MITTSLRKVVSLIRVSSGKQTADDKTGLDRQKNNIRFTCKQLGLEDVRQFQLNGVTGIAVRQTREFKELKAMLERKDICGLVIPSIDRLSRSTEFSNMAELFQPFEVLLAGKSAKRLFTMKSEFDIMNGEHRTTIFGQLRNAETYREALIFNTSSGRDLMRMEADSKVDKLPKGVLFTRTDAKKNVGTWSYDPEVKATMRQMFERVAAGESLRSLYRSAGYSTQSGFRSSLMCPLWKGTKAKTKTHAGKVWNEDKGKFMARNRVALPEDQQIAVDVPELRNDPCVSDELFQAVQDVLNRNSKEREGREGFSKFELRRKGL